MAASPGSWVSADGGRAGGGRTARASPPEGVHPHADAPWRWTGNRWCLQSRAWDEAGNVQPLRAEFVAARGQTEKPVTTPLAFPNQHYNSITSWSVDSSGGVKHVYA
jgi:sulfane dehydrogenase subunit SoxC